MDPPGSDLAPSLCLHRELQVRGLRRRPIASSRFGTAAFFDMISNLMGLNIIQ